MDKKVISSLDGKNGFDVRSNTCYISALLDAILEMYPHEHREEIKNKILSNAKDKFDKDEEERNILKSL
ncbi:hypothetical protein EMA8858_04166 [Emticicia aquatica]|uniref:Uncharacterized protein n=1 Tax=Emticicia aquatica TaxID=1681835 RepID=A0ABM9AVG0_9BACT|nr:hypothetical protein [Emticicia aquatica]CAH0998031.1 hypothetical protein EMA8858_04166 [Emticicia aquatica]